jgi:membrane associated rhomboid family serine protease
LSPHLDIAPATRTPFVTCALLLANLLAFLWQVDLAGAPRALARGDLEAAKAHLAESVERGGVIPFEILTLQDIEYRDLVPPPFTILTAMFLHGGVGHLLVNLLFLWLFGRGVEGALGHLRFLALYLACGMGAALVHVLSAAFSGTLLVPMVGASGAVAGVLSAHLRLSPRARVLGALPLRAAWLVAAWFAVQLFSFLLGADPGLALAAHLGGFALGLLLAQLWARRGALPTPPGPA